MWDVLFDWLKRMGPRLIAGAVPIGFIVWLIRVLLNRELADVWRARVYRAVYSVTGKTEHEKKYIANDVRGRLNTARRKMHAGTTAIPRAVAVVWVENAEGTPQDVRENEFIVRLDPSTEQERNIVLLAEAIVRRSSLAGIRHSVDNQLELALDLNLTRKLLAAVGNKAALDWFLSNDYRAVNDASSGAKEWSEKVLAIDERGLFTRMLLVELEDFARRIHGKPPRPYMAGEIEGLVNFLHKIATKQFGEKVPLSYSKAFIRVAVIMVAETKKLLQSIGPYLCAMRRNVQDEMWSVYFIVFDKDWLGEVNRKGQKTFEDQVAALDREVTQTSVATKVFDLAYVCTDSAGNRRRARCIRYVIEE